MAVLANKPELVIELLTKTNANHEIPDFSGRTLADMVEIYIPSYLESLMHLIETLQAQKQKEESMVVATHYYNPDDERAIKGTMDQDIYQKKQEDEIQNQINETVGDGNAD